MKGLSEIEAGGRLVAERGGETMQPWRSGRGRRFAAGLLCLSLLVILAGGGAGCRTPLSITEAGTFETKEGNRWAGTERSGVLKQIALYLPNRFMDMLDIVRFSFGVGLPLGFDIRLTKWAQLAASINPGVGVGWQGRFHDPAVYGVPYTAAFGPWRAGTGAGRALEIGAFEVGVDLTPIKVAIDFAEVADMILGWFFLDIVVDDWGWDDGP